METAIEKPGRTAAQPIKSNCELDAIYAIKKINYRIRSKTLAGSTALTLLEITCYLSSLGLLYIASAVSNGILTTAGQLSKEIAAEQKAGIEKITKLLEYESALLIALSFAPLLFGIAVRKLRKKNNALSYAKIKAKNFLERYSLD